MRTHWGRGGGRPPTPFPDRDAAYPKPALLVPSSLRCHWPVDFALTPKPMLALPATCSGQLGIAHTIHAFHGSQSIPAASPAVVNLTIVLAMLLFHFGFLNGGLAEGQGAVAGGCAPFTAHGCMCLARHLKTLWICLSSSVVRESGGAKDLSAHVRHLCPLKWIRLKDTLPLSPPCSWPLPGWGDRPGRRAAAPAPAGHSR